MIREPYRPSFFASLALHLALLWAVLYTSFRTNGNTNLVMVK